MWPFSILQRRKRDRTLKAATLIFLGTYLYDGLRAEEKARVDSEVADMWTGFGLEVGGLHSASWDTVGAFRSLAMAHLGIEPMAGVSWPELLKPWPYRSFKNLGLPDKDLRATFIVNDYHPMDQATEDAKCLLRAKGLDIPEIGPWSLPRIDGGKPMGPGEHSQWRKNVDV